jgi:hypothetical protein
VVSANRYGLTSRTFRVRASRALTAVKLSSAAGKYALELRYPQAVAHESVGEPAGDLNADLTHRPVRAASGRASFLVNGKLVVVSAGAGGVFRVSATDAHGNANGNALTLSP